MFLENKNFKVPEVDDKFKQLKETTVFDKKTEIEKGFDGKLSKVNTAFGGLKKFENMFDEAENKDVGYNEEKIGKLDNSFQLSESEKKEMQGWSAAEVNQFVADANYYKAHGKTNFEDYKQHLIRERNKKLEDKTGVAEEKTGPTETKPAGSGGGVKESGSGGGEGNGAGQKEQINNEPTDLDSGKQVAKEQGFKEKSDGEIAGQKYKYNEKQDYYSSADNRTTVIPTKDGGAQVWRDGKQVTYNDLTSEEKMALNEYQEKKKK